MRKRFVCGPSRLHLDGFATPIGPGEPFEYDFGSMEPVHLQSGAIRIHASQEGVVQPIVHEEPTRDATPEELNHGMATATLEPGVPMAPMADPTPRLDPSALSEHTTITPKPARVSRRSQ